MAGSIWHGHYSMHITHTTLTFCQQVPTTTTTKGKYIWKPFSQSLGPTLQQCGHSMSPFPHRPCVTAGMKGDQLTTSVCKQSYLVGWEPTRQLFLYFFFFFHEILLCSSLSHKLSLTPLSQKHHFSQKPISPSFRSFCSLLPISSTKLHWSKTQVHILQNPGAYSSSFSNLNFQFLMFFSPIMTWSPQQLTILSFWVSLFSPQIYKFSLFGNDFGFLV